MYASGLQMRNGCPSIRPLYNGQPCNLWFVGRNGVGARAISCTWFFLYTNVCMRLMFSIWKCPCVNKHGVGEMSLAWHNDKWFVVYARLYSKCMLCCCYLGISWVWGCCVSGTNGGRASHCVHAQTMVWLNVFLSGVHSSSKAKQITWRKKLLLFIYFLFPFFHSYFSFTFSSFLRFIIAQVYVHCIYLHSKKRVLCAITWD